ncbi:enoyl-CoA hydratase [Alkalithermobacter thermoalcaliphilus JW-YL-7 = DSM 7308]|uniref:short-chain-enoyl-CoA hydratase n=1 Tax=Alkalithermobacter thermoalcaliphilus JW-YL-7 = DSM 7308 TaxID=1121328 RepID=A0A150FRE4_CLOPD|nr:3-hydroxybutyryl-CoA dehydratase [[Clostridium] paradoxum JW-YL-7 = DSM 7308]SHK45281.1 enoyl-CoA hydratase [[Clostridium] paradoxum JW-YL-7 = DSM 7308]
MNIFYEKISNNIGLLKINRPKHLNSLNKQTLKELDNLIDDLKKDDDLLVLIITGEGEKAFVAGADIKEMKDMTSIEALEFSKYGNEVFFKLETLNKVVIAAINGFCLGGGLELALACDIRISSKVSKFGQPEVNLGIIPGFGATQRLTNIIGISKAKQMIFTGDIIDASEALNLGIVNSISDDPLSDAIKIANKITSKGFKAIIQAKKAINLSYSKALLLDYESECFANCFSTKDQKEGMSAFIQKRIPQFENK